MYYATSLDFEQVGYTYIHILVYEHRCNQSDIRSWEVRVVPFNAMVVQVLLYLVEVWAWHYLTLWEQNRGKPNKMFLH